MRLAILAAILVTSTAAAADPITASQPAETTVWAINTSILASTKLPPGDYLVAATLDAVNRSEKDTAMNCAIADGGMLGVDTSFADGSLALSVGSPGKLALEANVSVPADAAEFWIYFNCQGAEGTTTPLTVSNGVLTATAR